MEGIPSQGIAAKRISLMKFSTEAIVALAKSWGQARTELESFLKEQPENFVVMEISHLQIWLLAITPPQ
jgi:hypothetical protein